MADLNINPNLPAPDDDDAARVEKKRQVEAQQRTTADQRANAFKKTMQQTPNGPATPYAVQQQSKETVKPTKAGSEQIESLTPHEEPEGDPEIKPTPGVFKRSESPDGKPMGMMAKQSAADGGQPMARMSGVAGGSASSGTTENSSVASSSVQSNTASSDSVDQASVGAQNSGSGGSNSSDSDSSSEDRRSNADLTSRIDIASITPSFPSPTTQGHTPVAATPPPAGVNMQMIEQMVQFAAVGKTKEGLSEFHLGIGAGPLAGLNICLTACGRRRVKLRFSGVVDTDTVTDAQVNQLVNALQSREVEVVEVEIA